MEEVLICKIEGKIATMEINRPPYNPLNVAVLEKMTTFLEDLYKNEDVQVLVIIGSGEKAFSAGADIHQFVPKIGHKDIALTKKFHHTFNLINKLSIPVIAALKGHVLGAGLELALACDFRICDENTKFGLPEVNLGIFPGAGATQRLPRLVGKSKALEMMMFGTSIDAKEAKEFQLVNKVAEAGIVEEVALNWAKTLSEKSKTSLENIKKAVQRGLNLSLAEGLNYEMELFAEVFEKEDANEGIHAFLEKRPAKFSSK